MVLIGDADMLEDRFLGPHAELSWSTYRTAKRWQRLLGDECHRDPARHRRNSFRCAAANKQQGRLKKSCPLKKAARDEYRQEEQRLEEQIANTEERLAMLQSSRDEGAMMVDPSTGDALLSPEQRAEIKRFQSELAASRRALREVQRELRADVIALGARIKFLNVALVSRAGRLRCLSFAFLATPGPHGKAEHCKGRNSMNDRQPFETRTYAIAGAAAVSFCCSPLA